MDKFTRQILTQTGLLGMIGKADRGPEALRIRQSICCRINLLGLLLDVIEEADQ
jgi:tartrate dehydratase beta subunit/fumarate hydratase class I family protein